MGLRDPLGRGRNVRRRFVGSTFITAAGAFNQTVPAGVDSCDTIVVGGGGVPPANAYYGSGGGMAIRRNVDVMPGQIIAGAVGAAGQASTVLGMTANPGSAGTGLTAGGTAIGGDVNLTGGAANGTMGGCPSPAWTKDPTNPQFGDSGGPYIHPAYKGAAVFQGTSTAPGSGGLIASGGSVTQAAAGGGVFFFWYVKEVV